MKKIAVSLGCMLALGVSASVSAGPEVGLGIDQGLSVIVQLEDRINLTLGDDGVAGDYLFKKGTFEHNLPTSWYIGVGAFAGWDHGLGVRVPIGVEMKFDQRLEGYFQLAPAIDFDHHSDDRNHRQHTDLGVDAAIGIRYAL